MHKTILQLSVQVKLQVAPLRRGALLLLLLVLDDLQLAVGGDLYLRYLVGADAPAADELLQLVDRYRLLLLLLLGLHHLHRLHLCGERERFSDLRRFGGWFKGVVVSYCLINEQKLGFLCV